MKKNILLLILLLVGVVSLTGCLGKSEETDDKGLAFKNDYEAVNGQQSSHGFNHRSVEINKDNRFIEITPEDVVKKIENEETFYVYFGSRLCPWCRSVIEMADTISRDKDISVIYYVDIWDDTGAEILRDKNVLNENKELEVSVEGTESYKKLLEYFGDFLADYTLSDADGNSVEVGEKRIFAPNFVYIEKGKAEKLITGISSKLASPLDELTEEILKDEEEAFENFFVTYCDDKC